MLYAFDPPSDTTLNIHWTEISTIVIVTTMFFEEFRQVSIFHFNLSVHDQTLLFISSIFKKINISRAKF